MSKIFVSNLSAVYRVSTGIGSKGLLGGGKKVIKALNGISFELKEGDRLGVIGLNGSGKSTLLKVLSGDLPPTQGVVEIEGDTLSLLNRTSGLILGATLRQNAKIRAYALNISNKDVGRFVAKSIEYANLLDRADDPMGSLSTGMAARFNLAINSQVVRPIAILDEWIGTMDSKQSSKTGMLERLKSQTDILVVASHNNSLLSNICNKFLLLDNGNLRYFGEFSQEAFRELDALKEGYFDKRIEASRAIQRIRNPSVREYKQGTLRQTTKNRIHILNLGRTSVNKLGEAFQKNGNGESVIVHSLDSKLDELPVGEAICCIYRDPVERFISSFYLNLHFPELCKKRKGFSDNKINLANYYTEADQLARDLSSDVVVERLRAAKIMVSTPYLSDSILDWFPSPDDLLKRAKDIFIFESSEKIGFVSEKIKAKLNISDEIAFIDELEVSLKKHWKPLSDQGQINIKKYYQRDSDLIEHINYLVNGSVDVAS